MDKKDYIIGLDIGTTSVGWAVVNPKDYKVIRKGNKKLWGVRLFEEASTAVDRRNSRSTRRRYDRRRERIRLLQEEFNEEIKQVDSDFYKKMKESFYNEYDFINRTIKISREEKESIKKYNKEYPTIYHLRNDLINNKDKKDIRLIYLAIHHIIKYRGNFLYQSDSFNINTLNINEKLKSIFNNINNLCSEIDISINNLNEEFYCNLERAITNNSKTDKKILTKQILEKECLNNFVSEFIKIISSNQFSISKLLNIELEEDIKISFKGNDYEEKYSSIEKNIGDKIEIIEELKELYDMIFLKQLFGNNENKNLSSMMVSRYNKHQQDLKFLKRILKYDHNSYKKMFKDKKLNTSDEELCIYRKYINNQKSYDDFKKELNNLFKNIQKDNIDLNLKQELLKKQEEIEEGTFLPKITDTDNGKYPYQLNKEELIKIIENQGKYYPFLLNKINDKYKLVKLLEFRIPYYVGPLNNTTDKKNIQNKNAWLIKKNNSIKITPYNFDEVIDKEATAEKFITRMISNCTYINNEPALPNNSILYSKYKVMNEIKQIKINGKKMSNEFQHKLYENLFLKISGTITEKKFTDYLKSSNEYNMYETLTIEGYSDNKKFANNMQSYIDFFGDNGIFDNTDYTLEDAEEIIKWITIFEDKDILETKIRRKYNELSEKIIKLIMSKKYKGWGNLSQKLLTKVYYKDKVTGINKSIIDLMTETTENFMQILNNKEYKLQEEINKLNKIDSITKINYSLVDDLSTSPSIKRGIYQALKIVDEIVNYIGYNPKSIMIEMARGEEHIKERKDTKKEYIMKLYTSFKEEINNYNSLKSELDMFDEIDSQKLFLYFIQEGKSLYSGKTLNIEDLKDQCEIDHIIPRTLIKDDSIDNKALVLREENQNKAASFVIPSNYRTSERIIWWEHLKKCNLISNKKISNLCRNYYSDKDIEGFINRQLVETRQISKHVANILNNFYKNTKIVYLHANLSSNYREKNELFKYRDLNDYHHAHDAYLAAVLGEYKENYLKTAVDFERLRNLSKKMYEEGKRENFKYGYVINSIDNEVILFDEETGEVIFNADEFNKTIENTLYQNDILVTKKTEIKTGEFYNQTKNKKGKKGVPLKKNLPTFLYGAYTSLNPTYSIVIKYKNKKNREEQRLIGIPIVINQAKDKKIKQEYIAELLDIKDKESIEIIKDKIPFNSIIDWNGQICSLVGATNKVEVCNAKEFEISKENQIKWKYTLNRLFNKIKIIDDEIYNEQLTEIISYVITKIEKEYKLYLNLIDELKGYISEDILNSSNIEIKEKILIELFKLLKFNSSCANLKFLSEQASSAFGKKHSRIISNAKIINYSTTGIRKQEYEF